MRFSHCVLLVLVHLSAHVQAGVLRRQEEGSALPSSGSASGSPSATSSVPQPSATVGPNDASQRSRTLLESVVNTAFANDGMEGVNATDIIPSMTSTNNFINFCATVGLPKTNGAQVKEGSCNSVPMGAIPAANKIPSSKITNPLNGAVLAPKTQFTVSLSVTNFASGHATNPQNTYMSAPQTLDENGFVRGHLHIVIEQIISPNQTTPPDPTYFAYFKGINTAAVNGQLSTDVPRGLPSGEYRVCTLTSNANHGPLALAVAQRGSSEDCIYFTVGTAAPTADNSGTTQWAASLFRVMFVSLFVPLYLLF